MGPRSRGARNAYNRMSEQQQAAKAGGDADTAAQLQERMDNLMRNRMGGSVPAKKHD